MQMIVYGAGSWGGRKAAQSTRIHRIGNIYESTAFKYVLSIYYSHWSMFFKELNQ